MSLETMLTNTCDIQRWRGRQPGSDFTVNTPEYATVTAGVACSIQIGSATRSTTVGGTDIKYQAVGFFDYSVDIRPAAGNNSSNADRITFNGERWYVRAVFDESGRGILKKALLESGL